jgi:hypothetical protein
MLPVMAKPKAKKAKVAGRGSKFTLLLSRDESAQLRELAARDGVPASVFLRLLIRKIHADGRTARELFEADIDTRLARMRTRLDGKT